MKKFNNIFKLKLLVGVFLLCQTNLLAQVGLKPPFVTDNNAHWSYFTYADGDNVDFLVPVYNYNGSDPDQWISLGTVQYRVTNAQGVITDWSNLIEFYTGSQGINNWTWLWAKSLTTECVTYARWTKLSDIWKKLTSSNQEIQVGHTHGGIATVQFSVELQKIANYQNAIIEIRVLARIHDSSLGQLANNKEYNYRYPYVNGNPQTKPSITGQTFNADGRVTINVSNSYNPLLNHGTWGIGNYHLQREAYGNDIAFIEKSSVTQSAFNINTNVLTMSELTNGINYRIGSTRIDLWTHNQSWIWTYSDYYKTTPYPQPTNLIVQDLKNGQIRLQWTMAQGNSNSPTDAFSFQWAKGGESWDTDGKDFTVPVTYNPATTNYSVEINCPITYLDNGQYWFRIKRANLNWKNVVGNGQYSEVSINYNPQEATINQISFDPNTKTVSWSFGAGMVNANWTFDLTANKGAANQRIVATNIANNIRSYVDNLIPTCTPTNYTIDIKNGAATVSSFTNAEPVLLPDIITATIAAFEVSKGFYTNRVSLMWKVDRPDATNFTAFSVYRKEKFMDDAIELFLQEITASATENSYRFDDHTASPGIYYDYILKPVVLCAGNQTFSTPISAIGFTQSYGVITGRTTTEHGSAVENVNILVSGHGDVQNRSLQFNPAVSRYVEVPYKDGMLSPNEFSFQAWVKITPPYNGYQYFFSSFGRYDVGISKTSADSRVFLSYYLNGGSDNGRRILYLFSDGTFPLEADNEFVHITVTLNVTDPSSMDEIADLKLYINGELVEATPQKYSDVLAAPQPSNRILMGETDLPAYPNQFFNGYMDEVRIWKKTLTGQEVKNNYDRYISGKEVGLSAYYRFDELDTDEVFDISGNTNGVFNQNHGLMKGDESDSRSTTEVPTNEQLAIKGITDTNGHYLINTVPYFGDGSQYTIAPSLGVHEFNPTNRPLYFNQSSNTHNNIDFIDISTFSLTGMVIYEGGTFPVSDCTFEIDERPVVRPNGEPVRSASDGSFTISVPIGIHSVRVVKQGHTFANDGFLINEITGDDLNYNAPLNNIVFHDQTKIKLIGRIVGGMTENEKPLGFGESINNIGAQTIKLETTLPQYNFVTVPYSETYNHNNGQWQKPDGLEDDQTTVNYNQDNITINVSPQTGEFVAFVYPERYFIRDITVPAAAGAQLTIYDNNETLDLTSTPVPNETFMKTSIRTWADSIYVTNLPGTVDYWEYIEMSDTVFYHADWKYYYQATPTFSVKQMVNGELVDYFGDKTYELKDDLTGETEILDLWDETTDYLFGKPVFHQGTLYNFYMNAYEEYSNYVTDPDIPETVRYSVSNGRVHISNDIRFLSLDDAIEMDENGEALYIFVGGAPNLTTGSNNFFATLALGNRSYYWDMGQEPIEAWHLGDRTTGTDFMTTGPDEITAILRDPPGSLSQSFIEEGTSITSKKINTVVNGSTQAMNLTTSLGPKIKAFIGLGAGVITESEIKLDISAGLKTEEKWTSSTEVSTTHTFTERFETSDDPLYVGHYGDVFIGNSTNILYGLTNAITILKYYENEFDEDGDAFITEGDYSIAPAVSLAFGQTFDTRFAFTHVDIEEIMIPKWRDGLAIILQPVGTEVNTAIIEEPIYLSNLPHNHVNFGKLNTDPIFGTSASTPDLFHDGPSYTIYFPDLYNISEFTTDSVMFFNNQINGWIDALAQNEKEKVEMQQLGNYSFGSGATIQYSNTVTSSKTTTSTFHWMINPTIGLVTGGDVMGIGMELSVNAEFIHEEDETGEIIEETTITSGFILKEDGDDDQITVDYGMTASGTIAFKTRGGRTSCPYEDELRTKYFEPDMHILNEATMQIEVPKIRVDSAPMVINVPSNREAIFTLALENESETGEDVWFQLIVDEVTNPFGAILKIDGGVIGNGRYFLVNAYETLYKTLTVGKGTVDSYQNIALVLRSQCQSDPTVFLPVIADTAYISVEFVPGVSNVAITEPSNNWILNTDNPTTDTLYVSIADYDVNFPNFGYIRLEYRPISSPNWNTIMTFYPSHLYENAQGLKEDIGTRPFIVYPWKTPAIDGQYELRATVTSVNIDENNNIINVISSYSTDALMGYRDMSPPRPLGAPSPANGILTASDEISITFNEDIQTGMLTLNNFTISGILNAQEIAEPNVGLAFTGSSQHSKTEMPIFVNGSFSIETWFKRELNSAGTLFSFGSNEKYISLGFNAAGNCVLKIGNETYTSTITIANDETWKYISMSYDRENNSVSVYELEGVLNNNLFINQQLTLVPENQGRLFVGNNVDFNDGFNGAISHLHFYGKTRTMADISAEKNIRKSGREHGLIGYWLLDEAEGNIAEDKARSRHLTLQNDWYIYPSGYAKQTDNNYFNIQTATYPLDLYRDFTLEFWFRSENSVIQNDATLFSADNGYIATTENGGLALYKSEGTLNQTLISENVNDTKWHHFAMSVRRNGSVNVYINGENRAVFAENQLGSFASAFYCFGAKRINNAYNQYFNGYFDEIRIWNSALPRENIILNKNSKLHGDESGLLAYYPFETYVHQSSGLIVVMQSNDNMADEGTTTATGTAATSSVSVPVKDVRPIENVPFSFVASNNKIVLTLSPDYFTRVEGTILNISVKDIRDMRNNKSGTEQWTAFVRRNALLWDTDPININMQEGENVTFTARIINTGGTMASYSIENLPVWLSVNNSVGNLQPLQNRDHIFTVFQGINIGNYETAIELECGNGVTEILPMQLKVTGLRPNWYVNPNDFENSMNITGQIKIDGMFQEDPDDILAVFIDDLCVGVTSPTFMSSNNAYFTFANIYGNQQHNNKPLIFKLWDASTGRIYPQIETSINDIRFAPSSIIGNITNPVIFNALDITEQIINLNQGWNWISTNILNENPSIINQMKQSLFTSGELIKGRDAFIQQPNWVGNLAEISEKSMYLVKNVQAHALVLTGQPANPATTPITINQGWNWIGYVPSITLPVNSALAGIDANIDDQIKGQNGYAVYSGSNGWMGTLTFMQSGKGYMYFSNSETSQTLIYPTSMPQGMPPMAPPPSNITIDSKWEVNISNYSSTMTMTARVVHDDIELASELIEIGAFSGDECRGTAFLQYVENLNRYVAFLMIYGNGNEPIKLKVFDHATETEHNANNSTINFASDAIFGNPTNPYMIGLGTTVVDINAINMSQITVYPNPTTGEFSVVSSEMSVVSSEISDVSIEIFDAVGRLVHREPLTVNRATVDIDITHLENGIYFLRIGNETIKIVKR
ncbi:MAG: T9SS type A sorting domain-containing protein [Marinilabiliaceae bacterium]|nr:T9SS type A sorting domain-containing protein [Marinilabiliaceae bacterium]